MFRDRCDYNTAWGLNVTVHHVHNDCMKIMTAIYCYVLCVDLVSVCLSVLSHHSYVTTRVNMTSYPGMMRVPWYHVRVEPGDCLYLPYRWIHHVSPVYHVSPCISCELLCIMWAPVYHVSPVYHVDPVYHVSPTFHVTKLLGIRPVGCCL